MSSVHFIETPTFRRVCDALLSLDESRALQLALYDNPEAGDVISGTWPHRPKIRNESLAGAFAP